jgi:hypothetical protein
MFVKFNIHYTSQSSNNPIRLHDIILDILYRAFCHLIPNDPFNNVLRSVGTWSVFRRPAKRFLSGASN